MASIREGYNNEDRTGEMEGKTGAGDNESTIEPSLAPQSALKGGVIRAT